MRKPIFYEVSVHGHRSSDLGDVKLVANYAMSDFKDGPSRYAQAMEAVEELVQFTPDQITMRLMRRQEIKEVRQQIKNPSKEIWAQKRTKAELGAVLINNSLTFGEIDGREEI
ncbi:MAG TPA: hypothetical protein VFW90_02640 [Candidatus Saccharimonadales bacterium]|nr:hypothetical protein [Candidatus Saccharimonadales bacterium]